MATRETIVLRGNPREEGFITSEAITPGMLVEIDPSNADQILKHATAGGPAAPWFVREQHENQGADIDDNVASGDEATVVFAQTGDKINAYTSDTITQGDFVESDGVGGVRLYGSGSIVGVAAKDGDLSGTNGRVEIIIAPIGA